MSAPAYAAQQVAPALERYLKRATFGLNAERRQAIWDELEEHILTRQDGYCLLGHDPDMALRLAISELGPALKLSAGMNWVHNMPKMILAFSLTALLGALTAVALSSAPPLVEVISQRPIVPECSRLSQPLKYDPTITIISHHGNLYCYTYNQPVQYRGTFVNIDNLATTISGQGISVSSQIIKNGKKKWILTSNNRAKTSLIYSDFMRDGKSYIDLYNLVDGLTALGQITVTGYLEPTIQVGDVRFRVPKTPAHAAAAPLWNEEMYDLVVKLFRKSNGRVAGSSRALYRPDGMPVHTIQVGGQPDPIYGLIYYDAQEVLIYDFNAVAENGSVEFFSSRQKIEIVTDPKKVTPYFKNGRAQALLIRLSGRIDKATGAEYSIIQPSQLTSDAK
jgi:hypothetical protein